MTRVPASGSALSLKIGMMPYYSIGMKNVIANAVKQSL
jgi:hypothetical protein